MTSDKYQAMINASGGFTRNAKRGDRPQPLTSDEETALNKAWKNASDSEKVSSKTKLVRKPEKV